MIKYSEYFKRDLDTKDIGDIQLLWNWYISHGVTLSVLKDDLKVCKDVIMSMFKSNGFKLEKGYIKSKFGLLNKFKREDWEHPHALYMDNKSLRVSASILGISRTLLVECFRQHDLTIFDISDNLVEKVARTKTSNIEKYGVDNPFKLKSIQDKARNTCIERYGSETPFHNKGIQDKCIRSFRDKYILNSEGKKQKELKSRETCLLKYGVSHISKTDKFRNMMKNQKVDRTKVTEFYIKMHAPLVQERLKLSGYKLLEDYIGSGCSHGYNYYSILHESCGTTFKSSIRIDRPPKCPTCFPQVYGESQKVISDYVKLLGFDVVLNDRKTIHPYEIDILIPELNIGFEYNGTIWHSSKFQDDKNYHKIKTDLSLEKGIKLYHIWEHDNLDIIKSMVKSTLGKSKNRYYARKLKVKETLVKERMEFFNSNHLHGDVNSSFALGLYDKDTLISCISFRKHKEGIEIARFATLLNSSCVGGFSRLLKSSIHECRLQVYTKIITYCDRDWTPNYKDSVYFKNGFSFVKDTGVRLKYVKGDNTYSRETFQKHKLKAMFPETYSDEKTADQILEENNIYSIHNSGNWKFEMSL